MINILIQNLKGIVIFITKYLLNKQFDLIKNGTVLKKSDNVTITSLFNLIYNYYYMVYSNKGLNGVFKARKLVKGEINGLTWEKVNKLSNNTLTIKELNKSFPYLKPFREILIKIKYTTEILLLIRAIMSVLSSAAVIPIVGLFIYIIFRNLFLFTSVVFTTSFAPVVVSKGGHDFIGNLRNFMEYLSISFHNWLFNDNLIPAHIRLDPINNTSAPGTHVGDGAGQVVSLPVEPLATQGTLDTQIFEISSNPILLPPQAQLDKGDKILS